VALALYFLLVYRPLARKAASLDRPLTNVWAQLTSTNRGIAINELADLPKVEETLVWMERSGSVLDKAAQAVAARVELEPPLRAKLTEQFQLIDFQNERQFRIEQLTAQAKQKQVTLEPAALAGFPQYTADRQEPEVLWVQLAMVNKLVSTALACQVAGIKSISCESVFAHRSSRDAHAFMDEVPIRFELTGALPNIVRFLTALSLRTEDLKERSLAELVPARPALFINNLLVRRQVPDKPDEVQVLARVSGFIYRDPSP
jgi:hypothetical protein